MDPPPKPQNEFGLANVQKTGINQGINYHEHTQYHQANIQYHLLNNGRDEKNYKSKNVNFYLQFFKIVDKRAKYL